MGGGERPIDTLLDELAAKLVADYLTERAAPVQGQAGGCPNPAPLPVTPRAA